MTVEEASKILKMLLGFLKGEIEPPSPKTIEEAEKFEQDGYECLNMAIRSLETLGKVKEEVLKTQTYIMFEGDTDLYVERKDVLKIIDKHLKEVENDNNK